MKAMSSRDRVLASLNRQKPDRIPIDLGGRVSSFSVDVYEALRSELSLPVRPRTIPYDLHYERLGIAEFEEDLLERLKVDTRYLCFVPPVSRDPGLRTDPDGNSFYRDEWGVGLRRPAGTLYYNFDEAPLGGASREELDRCPWPETDDSRDREWEEKVRTFRAGEYAIVLVLKGVYEQSWPLRGLERFYMDMAMDPDFAAALMDRVVTAQKRIYGRLLDVAGPHLDLVLFTDDVSGQNGPLFSPAFYRSHVKPRQKELIDFFRGKTRAKMAIHSDGAVSVYLPDFIDIGADVLNPVQVTASGMDPKRLKEEYGKKLSFWAGIDTQDLLPFGTPPQVEETVADVVAGLSRGGGYLFAPAHNIQSGTPVENVLAMLRGLDRVNGGC